MVGIFLAFKTKPGAAFGFKREEFGFTPDGIWGAADQPPQWDFSPGPRQQAGPSWEPG